MGEVINKLVQPANGVSRTFLGFEAELSVGGPSIEAFGFRCQRQLIELLNWALYCDRSNTFGCWDPTLFLLINMILEIKCCAMRSGLCPNLSSSSFFALLAVSVCS